MQIGIFAKTFPGTLEQCLDQVAAHGIRVIHFNMACAGLSSLPTEIPETVAAAIGAAVRRRGLEMAGVSATYNMVHPNEEEREKGLAALRAVAGAATHMGTRLLTLCTGTRDAKDKWRRHPDNDSQETWRELRQNMEAVLEIAEAHDLLLGIEPEEANVIRNAATARRFLDEMKTPRLQIILDPANLFDQADPAEIRRRIAEAVDLLGPDLIMAHAKDRTCTGDFRAAGKGDVDFDFFIGKLMEAGFDGPLVMHGLTAQEVEGSLAFLSRIGG